MQFISIYLPVIANIGDLSVATFSSAEKDGQKKKLTAVEVHNIKSSL
jgi:hypothetical protein